MTSGRDVRLESTAGDVNGGAITAERDIAIRANGGGIRLTSARAGDDIVLRASRGITAGSLTAGPLASVNDESEAGDALAEMNLDGNDIDVRSENGNVGITTADARGAGSDIRIAANSGEATGGSLLAGQDAAITARSLARFDTVTAARNVSASAGSVLVGTTTATSGSLALTANSGQLTLGTGSAGTTATLTKSGAEGEVAVTSSLTSGTAAENGDATITSSTNARLASVTNQTGRIAVDAQFGQVIAGTVRTVQSDDDIRVRAGTLAQISTAAAGRDLVVTAGNRTTPLNGSIDIGTGSGRDIAFNAVGGTLAAGTLTARDDIVLRASRGITAGSLTAGPLASGNDESEAGDALAEASLDGNDIDASGSSVNVGTASARGAGSDIRVTSNAGQLTLGTGEAGATATLAKSGSEGELQVTSLTTGTAGQNGDARIVSSTNARLARVESRTGSASATATAGEVTGVGSNGRATLVARAAGADVTVNAGNLARLGTLVAGRNVTVNANAIDIITAQGLNSNSTVALNARAGNLTLQNAVSNGVVQLTSSGAINATGRVLAVGNVTATGGSAANLASVQSRNGNINVTADTINVGTATADTGSLTMAADVGDLTLGTGVAGTTADLRTTAGTGDVIVSTSLTSGGDSTIRTVSDARLARVESLNGDVSVRANGGAVTGFGGGRGTLVANGAEGDITVDARDLVLLQTVAAENNVSITGGTLDIDTVQARNGVLTLTAFVDDITLGAGAVGGNAALTARRDVNLLRFLKARRDILLSAGRDVNGEENATSTEGTVTVIDPVNP